MSPAMHLERFHCCLASACPIQASGKITKVIGLVIESRGPASKLGTVCDIFTAADSKKIAAEVLGFGENKVLLMPLEDMRGIGPGCRVVARQERATINVGPGFWVGSLMGSATP